MHPLKPPHISLSLDCVTGSATFDRKLMYVATRNLLLNAFKYATSQVHMQVWLADGQLHIDVDDDGPGIPAGERDRVFEPSSGWIARATAPPAATAWGYPSCG